MSALELSLSVRLCVRAYRDYRYARSTKRSFGDAFGGETCSGDPRVSARTYSGRISAVTGGGGPLVMGSPICARRRILTRFLFHQF